MKTKEDVLGLLQNYGINAVICNSLQKGTWVFIVKTQLSPKQYIDILTEIGYRLECTAVWYRNWLTIYTEIPQNCLSNFREVLDFISNDEKINFQLPLMVRAQKDLSDKQLFVKVNFTQPASKRILNKICWLMQLKFNVFCQNISNNEFIIDYDASINIVEIRRLWDEEKKKRHYARVCGRLSRLWGIPFVNIMAMGTDEVLLGKHLLSMERAAGLIAAQEKSEKTLLYFQLFKGNKENKEKAIKSLGIEIGDADVMKIDFSMLEDAFR